ncbi:MAG: molybdenum cofactor guanylyltransferase [Acidobacteria bacterium]|nr:molybdenum cofactor guanylyltransferase [Acidobacteriota bacterium]
MNTVAILCGGHATRFGGRDKSALVVEGRTILARQLAGLSSLSDDILLVGGASPAAQSFEGRDVRAIADLKPGCGPLGGIHAALTEARGDAVFVVACDMPFVTAALGAFLLGLAGSADVVVPRTERGYHPLCAVYTRACLGPVARRLGEGRLALRDLIGDAEVRARVVTAEEMEPFGGCDRLLANVNTPAEWASLDGTAALQGHRR